MDKPRPQAAAEWLVTVAQLSTDDPASRMHVLRMLESLGAAVLREGAYLLPDAPANRKALEALVDYIAKFSAVAHLLHVTAASPAQHEAFLRLFDRSARYEDLIKTVESLRLGYGQTDPSAISRVLHEQRRDFEAIGALDFFPTPMRERARKVLQEADAAVQKLLFRGQAHGHPGGHRKAVRTHLGDAQAALGGPPRLRLADPPLRRSRGEARLARQGAAAAIGRDRFRLRWRAFRQQRKPGQLRGNAGTAAGGGAPYCGRGRAAARSR